MTVRRPCSKQMKATSTAVRHVYFVSTPLTGSRGPRGKKTRNKRRLLRINAMMLKVFRYCTYMTVKQNHCTPTCAIPNSPAMQENVPDVLQHATSALEAGRTSMFAKAHVPDVAPSRMK